MAGARRVGAARPSVIEHSAGAVVLGLALIVLTAGRAAGQGFESFETAGEEFDDIAELSLEELMQIDVTTVSGSAHEWFKSPAAVYVITGEDVRRAGARSLPEALRLAPGVFVGRVNSQSYSIGARGFNGGLGNKTLVLIDGRTVYDPLFSGTFWNVQDVLLEDLDRIEVVRGPGPTLWGANAVNGVINIITKSASETQGLYLSGGGGTEERGFGMARYGAAISDSAWFRVYGKYFERDALDDPVTGTGHDDWNMFRGGFRFDFEGDDDTFMTIQGDAYHSDRIGESILLPVPGSHLLFARDIRDARNSGANVLFRIGQESRTDPTWMLQAYYDRTVRVTNAGFEVNRDTFDVAWRHRFDLDERHEIMWGLGAQHTRDDTEAGPNTRFDPRSRSLDTFTAFVQDTITLVPDRVFAMVGSKLEENDLTGFEFQPSARVWWTPSENHTLWAAVSRPVRVPSRTEEDAILTIGFADPSVLAGGPPSGVTLPLEVAGDRGLDSERIWAWEMGCRVRPVENLTLDFALFYNDYSRLIFVPPGLVGSFNNDGEAETYGGEIAARWRPAENWGLEASYSFVDVQVHGPIASRDEGNTPQHQAQLRSYLDLTDDLELNSVLYYVDELPTPGIGDYVRLDIGLTWRLTENFELSIWGQNLLDSAHPEFSSREVERGAYLQGTFRF